MSEALREAILSDLRGRKLLKYLFAEEPEDHGPYGYIQQPIDLETQHECVDAWIAIITSALSSMVERDAVIEECAAVAERDVRSDGAKSCGYVPKFQEHAWNIASTIRLLKAKQPGEA